MDINPAAGVKGARGNAHGVVAKLGTGHFNPIAEARLSANFAHRLEKSEQANDAPDKSHIDDVELNDSLENPSATTDTQPDLSAESPVRSDQVELRSIQIDSQDRSSSTDAFRPRIDLTA